MKLFLKTLRMGLYALAGSAALGAAAAVGVYFYLTPQLPSIDNLKEVRLQVPLRIYSRDGRLLAEFGEMKRTPLAYGDIPEHMVKAVLAAEDDRFFQHPGVDYQGILRAAWVLATTGQKAQGGSTITMQVARNFFLSSEKTYLRKLNEILLAIKIEEELSKEEILELYLNKIYLGQRAYGVGAAAQTYYGKKLPELSLGQLAMIAGLPKAPSRNNPIADPERALIRRNYVLGRMFNVGYIDETTFKTAVEQPDTAALHGLSIEAEAPYLTEMARAEVVRRYGETEAYTGGYKVYTTLNTRLQTAANGALRGALLDYDRRHGYRGPEARVTLAEGADTETWIQALADRGPIGTLQPALVIEVAAKAVTMALKDGSTTVLAWEGMNWAQPYINETTRGKAPESAADVLSVGDVIRIERNAEGQWQLAQIPQVEGALAALDPRDGSVAALVGGFDYFRSKFNRAIQAERQPGSAFKPFVYSAALEMGMTPATIINDAPVVFEDAGLEQAWRPENYSGEFYGPTRLREALTHSRNLVSIRVLRSLGIGETINYLKRFGFETKALPRNLSLSLGSGSITPLQLAGAYTVLANGGFRVTPYFIDHIDDMLGNTLYSNDAAMVCPECEILDSTPRQKSVIATTESDTTSDTQAPPMPALAPRVISAQNTYLITNMMQDVIRDGTGRRARALGRSDIAGKTGTTNDQRDAWFAGYNAAMVAVAWVGFDDGRPMGNRETGGRAALPIWIDFMRAALAETPDLPWPQPSGLVTVRIDPETGQLAEANAPDAIFETFYAERVPSAPQTAQRHSTGAAIPEQLF